MSMSNFTLLALVMHVLADFHFQREGLARSKQARLTGLVLHGLIYAAAMSSILLLDWTIWPAVTIIAASHLLMDAFKKALQTRLGEKGETALFLTDQALHILVIVLCLEALFKPVLSWPQWPSRDSIKWVLLLLLITKPANMVMKMLLKRYTVLPKAGQDITIAGAGAMIGSLERILVAILLGLSQFAAVGLVFTAKSIARFDRISKDQGFAEYYLIGSLTSLLWVFISWLMLFSGLG